MCELILNDQWNFREAGAQKSEIVTIPHTVAVEPLDVYLNKQGIFEYERKFSVEKMFPGQKVFLKFEAVMMNCKVYVNKELLTEHFGGYLPFLIDITDVVHYDSENTVFVVVDNRDDPDTPPGKPTDQLDFLYYGGIYRDVKLIIKPQMYLTDPMDKSVERGGVRIETAVSGDKGEVTVYENIKNCKSTEAKAEITYNIFFEDWLIHTKKETVSVMPNSDCTVNAKFVLENPRLWDIDSPDLYKLETVISFDENQQDRRCTDFGIRTVSVDSEGFWLNGKKVRLFGLNRGQQYPYLGIAVSNDAHRREARMLKESRINCLRLAHYPHSPAFIEECDRLGILLIDPVPGWQFLGGKIWKERLRENLVDLVRRDRNHPSVVIFEVTPNETNWSKKEGDIYLHGLHEIVKRECPGALTGGDTVGRKNAMTAGFDVPFYGKDSRSFISRFFKKDTRLTLKREYGDWSFGGNKSTSRVSRGDGEAAMQLQTWNFQFAHNDNLREGGILGDLIWEGIDHNRGYYPEAPISKSGVYDIFRIPKLSYQFVRSQAKALNDEDYVIYLNALKWENKSKLVFYSNCDFLELYADGKLIASSSCDNGSDKPFDERKSKQINDNYWMTKENHIVTSEKPCLLAKHVISCMFDGGNCQHMDFPPFTFINLDLKDYSTLEVKGFYKNECVKTETFYRNNPCTSLKIQAQTFGYPLRADDNDFIFIHVSAVDDNGNTDTDFNDNITLTVQNGSVIGHDTIKAEVGVAGFMVKADSGVSEITLTASVSGVCESSVTFSCSNEL